MEDKKKPAPVPKNLPQPVSESGARSAARVTRGRTHAGGASFPVAPPRADLPDGYGKTLGEIKRRIQEERLRVVLTANTAMVLLYWDIGRVILDRQEREGWGAKVIDRLAADLHEAFPDMKGFSPRNLKYMRAFAAAWPDGAIVQQRAAQIPWFHNCVLLDRISDPTERDWYVRQVVEHGWSRNILALQIDGRAHARHGKALTNFKATLPPVDSDLAAQVFKDPYLFDFLGTADPRREREVEQALVDHIQRFLLELGSGFAFVGRQVLAPQRSRPGRGRRLRGQSGGRRSGPLLSSDKAAYVRQRGFEPLQQEQMVLRLVERHGRITRRQAAELRWISGPQAHRLLTRRIEQGLLPRENERGRGVGYRTAAK